MLPFASVTSSLSDPRVIPINSQTTDGSVNSAILQFSPKRLFATNVKICSCLSPCCVAMKRFKSHVCELPSVMLLCWLEKLLCLGLPSAVPGPFAPGGTSPCQGCFWDPPAGCPSHRLGIFGLTLQFGVVSVPLLSALLLLVVVQLSQCFLLEGRRLLLQHFLAIL